MSAPAKPPLVFVWEKFGPYHMDRCEALARHFADRHEVIGIEVASHGDVYYWAPTGSGRSFRKLTLFPGRSRTELSVGRYFLALFRAILATRARTVFICGFELAPIFLTALCLRLCGRTLVVMQDSKLDDKPRRLAKEWLKYLLYKPYKAALVGTPRSREYLAFLGLPGERIVVGYDALSLDRIAGLAGAEPAPRGVAHGDRHFSIIARFVPAKNLAMAIDAYAAFRRQHPGTNRELHLCGSGPLEEALKAQVARVGLEGVRFRGYLQEREIAATLASSLALILPSTEEPFGLVVNEALALGVPVLLSENCGARDLLVRSAVNGYVFEPDNVEGLAHFMGLLHRDRDEWARLAGNSQRFRAAADTGWFVRGVAQVLDALAGRGMAAPRRRPRLFETSWPQSRGPAPRDGEQTAASTEGVS